MFGLPVVKTEARMITEEQRQALRDIWVALKGIGMGAPLDMDYAKELADKLDEIIK